ncbi:hypothetical protein QO003_003173 [Arthrobacter silviterrae]|nr:hypothetical protein [Arthrobacter silviterrae]
MKNTGLGKLPFFDFHANQAWANIATLAMNLISWLQLAILSNGNTAQSWGVKRWRYRLFATAGKLITRARRTWLLISEMSPETSTVATLLAGIAQLKHRRKACPRQPENPGPAPPTTRTPPQGPVETDAHPATTGPPNTPKNKKTTRPENKSQPGRPPNHHKKSGLVAACHFQGQVPLGGAIRRDCEGQLN